MNRLEIVCWRPVLEELTTSLQTKGLLQIEEVPTALDKAPGFLHRVHLSQEQRAEATLLEDAHRLLREIEPLIQPKPDHAAVVAATSPVQKRSEEEWVARIRELANETRSLARKKASLQDNIEVLKNYQTLLASLEPLLGGKELHFGRDARAVLLKGDVKRIVARLRDRLDALAGKDVEFIHRRVSRGTVVGVIRHHENKNDAVSRVLREQGIDPIDAPSKELAGAPPRQVLEKVAAAIEKQTMEVGELTAAAKRFSDEHGAELAALSALVHDKLSHVKAFGEFAQSDMLAVVQGWIPQSETQGFIAQLEQRFPGKIAVDVLPADQFPHEHVPTLLDNPSWLKPFEVLLSLYRPPTYGTFDPTTLVAVSFTIFYGYILGDVGYGLAVIAFAYFLNKKWGHNKVVRSAATVGVWMGASAIVFGVLFAEYFGNLFEKLFGFHAIWIHRSQEANVLMIWAVAMGAVHIVLSMLIGIREDFRHRHTQHALEKLALLLGLFGVGVLAVGSFNVAPFNTGVFSGLAGLLLVAFVGIMIKASGFMALIHVLEIVSLIGNVLSYCRLMALGLAGVCLADLANLAGESLHPAIGIPLAAAIHLFNIGLGMFSPTLHSLRLNYVESMSKFYSPHGKTFSPFKKEALW